MSSIKVKNQNHQIKTNHETMKQLAVFFIFSFLSTHTYSQSSTTPSNQPANAASNEQWDLKKYLWSHTHSGTIVNDQSKLNFDDIDNFTGVGFGEVVISPDGKYFRYSIQKTAGRGSRVAMIIQSISGQWKREFPGAEAGFFSSDSKQYVFNDKNALNFIELGKDQSRTIEGLLSFKKNEQNEWIAYQLKNTSNTVILQNIVTGKQKQIDGVSSYDFHKTGRWFSYQLKSEKKELFLYNLLTQKEQSFEFVARFSLDNSGKIILFRTDKELKYANLDDGTTNVIWQQSNNDTLENYAIDAGGKQVAFIIKKDSINSVWYWTVDMKSALKKAEDNKKQLSGLQLQSAIFSDNGKYLLLGISEKPINRQIKPELIKLSVWSYADTIIQSHQPALLNQRNSRSCVLEISDGSIIYGDNKNETSRVLNNLCVVVKKGRDIYGDRFWESGHDFDSVFIKSLGNGDSRFLFRSERAYECFTASPDSRYLVYFDVERGGQYFSYDVTAGREARISKGIPDGELVRTGEVSLSPKWSTPEGLVGWLPDGTLLVYDHYDIWQLDLTGKKPALNITNGFGKKNGLLFQPMVGIRRLELKLDLVKEVPLLNEQETFIIEAFNRFNKQNGFYKIRLGTQKSPELLYMDNCIITGSIVGEEVGICMDPIKASSNDIWIVKKQTQSRSPNYYSTVDFKTFNQLTFIEPEKSFDWYSCELHTFRQIDGRSCQGLLYKPHNFDPRKKYPVLIIFYLQFSKSLNAFRPPNYIDRVTGLIRNPLWLVSQDYLLFVPDITTEPLRYGPSALNTIDGAARYLKQLRYVDGKKLGGGAHSWSSKLGTYVFTHSRSLSAMAISEGFLFANPINHALSINEKGHGKENGESRLETAEKGFEYGNLWKNKATWLDQTAVLNADKVTMPLLLYCGGKSSKDYQDQAAQLFTSLYRLEKKTWWLQYDNGSHNLDLSESKDFTIRFTQYFDHYLKDAPAPRWMTQGLPYSLKGVESRLELDPAGSCGKDCKICMKWNDQYKKTPEMFEKPISEWSLDKDIKLELDRKTTEERRKLNKQGEKEQGRIIEILKKANK